MIFSNIFARLKTHPDVKHTLIALLTILLVIPAMAADDWKSYFKNNEVEILYRYVDCHDDANGLHQQKILLRFVNLQNKRVELSFTKALIFSNNSSGIPDVRDFKVQLEPKAALEGDCTTRNNRLFIFSKQLNFSSTHLEKFELKNIVVKPIQ